MSGSQGTGASMNLEQVALKALEAYSMNAPVITFLRHNENVTFHVADKQAGNAYLLRIHSPLTETFLGERQLPEVIESELRWLEALADETDLILQRPVRTQDGALVTTVIGEQGNFSCSLLQWIEADLFPMSPLPNQVVRIGTIIAMLHTHARKWTTPETFTRPVYDLAFHRQQISTLATGVRDGIIRETDIMIIQEVLEQILAELAQLKDPLLLIHTDLHRGNLLVAGKEVYPIDFSLCGFGFPLFDLGTCLPGIPAHLRSVFLESYQKQEILPPGYHRLIDAFFLLSRMGAYVYLLPDPTQHEWLKKRIPSFTAQECQMFLKDTSLLFGETF
jgi:Ser/Thr protein kinase RdoA (MazF antagonist)